MTPIERSYEWFKRADSEIKAKFRDDHEYALTYFRTTFKDKSITAEEVDIILSDREENVKQRDLLVESIDKLSQEITQKSAELSTLRKKLRLFKFVTNVEFDERANKEFIMRKQEENRLAEIERQLAVKHAIEEQQKIIAQQTNLTIEEVKSVVEDNVPKKKRKQVIKG